MVQSGWRVDLNWYVLRVEPFLCYARFAPRTLLVIPMNRPVFISFFIFFFFFAFLLFVREIILFSRSNRPNMYREIPTTKRKNDDTNDKWIRNNRESLNWNITDENNRHLVRKGYQGTDAMITDRFLFSFHGPILLTWRLYWPLHHRIETDKEISPRLRLFIAVNNHAKCMRTMKI